MPSLIATLGLNANAFKKGLDKARDEAKKSGGQLQQGILDGLKSNKIFSAIASPIGAASAAAVGFVGLIIAKVDELQARAREITIGAAKTNLTTQQFQPLFNASQAVGADPEAAGKAIVKLAEAQEKLSKGGKDAAEVLTHFTSLGVTLDQIKAKSPQELFLQIANAMHVSQLSASQMAAGAELLGKSFEALEPVFKRGFNQPVDQMKSLTDDEIDRLNKMSRNVALLKEGWAGAMQTLANFSVRFLTGSEAPGPDEDAESNLKRLQKLANSQDAAKAARANARLQEGLDRDANLKKAEEIDKQTREEERLAKLRAMSPKERLAELKKETAELEKQAVILLAKLNTEKDAASAPALAEINRQISKLHEEAAGIHPETQRPALQLTDFQRNLAASFAQSAANNHAQATAQNTAKTANLLEQLVAKFDRKTGEVTITKPNFTTHF